MAQFRVNLNAQTIIATKNKISVIIKGIPLVIIQDTRITIGATLQYGSYTLELANNIPKPQITSVAAMSAKKKHTRICILLNKCILLKIKKTNKPIKNANIYIARISKNDKNLDLIRISIIYYIIIIFLFL